MEVNTHITLHGKTLVVYTLSQVIPSYDDATKYA